VAERREAGDAAAVAHDRPAHAEVGAEPELALLPRGERAAEREREAVVDHELLVGEADRASGDVADRRRLATARLGAQGERARVRVLARDEARVGHRRPEVAL